MKMVQSDSINPVPATVSMTTNAPPSSALGSVAPPSTFNPQSLGREFVRQYYTVLNEGPHILHRFYSDDSSLVHGCSIKAAEVSSATVYGQAEINSKIMSLNFKDCHTKIRQVDSLETVGKGVVIQVIGELSNDGAPMRRFFQTFVLAPRSPTNYYVRNDIFRYQDEVFADDEDSSDMEKVEEPEKQPIVEKCAPIIAPAVPKELTFEAPSVVNGHSEVPEDTKTIAVEDAAAAPGSAAVEVVDSQLNVDEWNTVSEVIVEKESGGEMQQSRESRGSGSIAATPPPTSTEPKTYADIIQKMKNAPFSNAPVSITKSEFVGNPVITPFPKTSPTMPTENVSVPTSVTPVSQQQLSPSGSAPSGGSPASGKPPAMGGNQMRFNQRTGSRNYPIKPRFDAREMTPGAGGNGENELPPNGDGGDFASMQMMRRPQFADEQQVFVGNLPQDINEDQLKIFFGKFGNIIDVRINRTNQKAGRTPNYGFVTFDDSSIVRAILQQKPIYFNEHRFNVEEKRSQSSRLGGDGMRMGNPGRGGLIGPGGPRPMGHMMNSTIRPQFVPGQRRDRGNQPYGASDGGRRSGGGGIGGTGGGGVGAPAPPAPHGSGIGMSGPRNALSYNNNNRR